MENPAWRFNGNERKYIEEVLATGFRAGADGAFTTRLEKSFSSVSLLFTKQQAVIFDMARTFLLHQAIDKSTFDAKKQFFGKK